MKIGIALFDFDGTITSKDTLLEFIKFSQGKFRFYRGFLYNIHYLVGYKMKVINNQYAKEKIFRHFFQNMALEEFESACIEFIRGSLPQLIRKKAVKEIKILKEKGFDILVVSASPENWISHWADENGLHLIATRLEIKNGKLTGNISGKNCYGTEKLRRIEERFSLADYKEIYAYGDSPGDKPMLARATRSFYRPFQS